MKKLLFILVIGFVLFSSIDVANAEEPYVYLTFGQKKVKLGSMLIWDTIIPEALTLKVNSNCFHGPVVASMSPMENSIGHKIKQNRVFIKTSATGRFISMSRPVVISEPAFGSHDIVIDFKVEAHGPLDRAGRYSGTLAFTIMPPA